MKKIIGKIHRWLGLTSGLVVFIVSVTGCIYVYEEELKTWLYKDREVINVPDHPVKKTLSELLAIAEKEAGKDHPIQNIEIPRAGNHTYVFRPAQIRNNKALTHVGEIVYQQKLYINPYTGEVVKNENTKYEFFTLVLRLHRNLLLNRKVGSTIVGISVLIFVIILITGIVLWWPKNKAAIKKAVSFSWKSTTRWRRKNYDLHNVLGFYTSFILLIIALTGLVWSFDWFDHSVQWIANGGTSIKKRKPFFSDTTKQVATLPLDKIHSALLLLDPEAHTFNISLPEKDENVVSVSARSHVHIRHTTKRYQFDPSTGGLLIKSGFEDLNRGEKLRAMNYDIHVGGILGPTGKLLAFFASLISASLPITGFMIWYGRKNKKMVATQSKRITKGVVRSLEYPAN